MQAYAAHHLPTLATPVRGAPCANCQPELAYVRQAAGRCTPTKPPARGLHTLQHIQFQSVLITVSLPVGSSNLHSLLSPWQPQPPLRSSLGLYRYPAFALHGTIPHPPTGTLRSRDPDTYPLHTSPYRNTPILWPSSLPPIPLAYHPLLLFHTHVPPRLRPNPATAPWCPSCHRNTTK